MCPEHDPSAPASGDAAHHASIVKELARRRRIRAIGDEIANRAKDRSADPGSVLADAAEYLRELAAADCARILPGKTLAKLMSEPRQPREWVIPGLLRKGKTCIVFGASFSGKSFLFWQYALQASLEGDEIFSAIGERGLNVCEFFLAAVDFVLEAVTSDGD